MIHHNDSFPLIFIHLTKTAGGSFRYVLEESMGDNCIFYNAPDVLPSVAQHHKLIFGHFPFGLHESLGLPPRYGCVVRDPFSRVVSHYYHLYNHEAGVVGNQIRTSGEDINNFFATSYHWEFENFMCKMLSGQKGIDSPDGVDDIENIYEAAQENLQRHFIYTGVFEHLYQSAINLSRHIHINITLIPRVNTGIYDTSIVSLETKQRILNLNYYDVKLYRGIVEQFLKKQ